MTGSRKRVALETHVRPEAANRGFNYKERKMEAKKIDKIKCVKMRLRLVEETTVRGALPLSAALRFWSWRTPTARYSSIIYVRFANACAINAERDGSA